ncbi:Dps family protein [Actinopolymorpha alba]|uniref:Dps family protein n=1 Tax=Actinopolymorpha alba TaxID=533267 RepID=UPI0003A96838|nr:DNA starvation/stationary phase protection protein [Actinopolymorpha alba]
MSVHETLPAVTGAEVARFLQPVLVDLVALGMNGKQAHWHVRGRHLLQVHEQLDLLVDDVRHCSDVVAARLVALEVPADGRPSTVATTTSLPEVAQGFAEDDKVVNSIVDQIDAVIARARHALDPLEDLDRASQDVVIDVLRGLEKHRWTFAAQVAP